MRFAFLLKTVELTISLELNQYKIVLLNLRDMFELVGSRLPRPIEVSPLILHVLS
jgi:hypothetical protein